MRGSVRQRWCDRGFEGAGTLAGLLLALCVGLWGIGSTPARAQVDANGLAYSYGFLDLQDPCVVRDEQGAAMLTFARFDANDTVMWTAGFANIDAWCDYARSDAELTAGKTEQPGWTLCHGDEDVFWPLQALLYICPAYRSVIGAIESRPRLRDVRAGTWGEPAIVLTDGDNLCYQPTAVVSWNPNASSVFGRAKLWHSFPPLVGLAHELIHAQQRVLEDAYTYASHLQIGAMKGENIARYAFYRKVPGYEDLRPRPGNMGYYRDSRFYAYFDDIEWADWSPDFDPLVDIFEEE